MLKTIYSSIDIKNLEPKIIADVKQYDSVQLFLEVRENNKFLDISNNELAIKITREDKKHFVQTDAITAEDKNIIKIILKNGAFAVKGKTEFELQIRKGTNTVHSATFIIRIIESVTLENVSDLEEYKTILETVIDMQKIKFDDIVFKDNKLIFYANKVIVKEILLPKLIGVDGTSLDFQWDGTRLGIKRSNEVNYVFVDLKGETGNTGPQGPKGEVGPQGPQGNIGPQGEIGPRGPIGETGAQGPKGDTGNIGPIGPQGIKGDTGKGLTIKGSLSNVSELPLNGNEGDGWLINGELYVWAGKWENVGNIKGPKGDIGPIGPSGPQGERGIDGVPGAKGDIGPKGETGAQGPKGETGTFDSSTQFNELQTTDKTVLGAINEVFQDASSGKNKIAAAITGKGVNSSVDDTFEILANNINKINTSIFNVICSENMPAVSENSIWIKENIQPNKITFTNKMILNNMQNNDYIIYSDNDSANYVKNLNNNIDIYFYIGGIRYKTNNVLIEKEHYKIYTPINNSWSQLGSIPQIYYATNQNSYKYTLDNKKVFNIKLPEVDDTISCIAVSKDKFLVHGKSSFQLYRYNIDATNKVSIKTNTYCYDMLTNKENLIMACYGIRNYNIIAFTQTWEYKIEAYLNTIETNGSYYVTAKDQLVVVLDEFGKEYSKMIDYPNANICNIDKKHVYLVINDTTIKIYELRLSLTITLTTTSKCISLYSDNLYLYILLATGTLLCLDNNKFTTLWKKNFNINNNSKISRSNIPYYLFLKHSNRIDTISIATGEILFTHSNTDTILDSVIFDN